MALKIEASQISLSGMITSDRRLCLAADEKTVVEDGDADARFLLCSAGGEIPPATVKRLGLEVTDGKVAQSGGGLDDAEDDAEDKQGEKPEDKSRTAAEDKGRKGRGK